MALLIPYICQRSHPTIKFTVNPTAAALMHQQAALGYTTYALPASSSPYSIPAQYPSAQQTVAQTPTATPTQ